MTHRALFLAVLCLGLGLGQGLACTADGGESDGDADTDGDADGDAGGDADGDLDGGGDADADSPVLDGTHAAFGVDPRCWGCHTEDDHNADLDPYECAACHGDNGASPGHARPTTPCGNCHSPPPHGAEGFPDPDSCMTCHTSS